MVWTRAMRIVSPVLDTVTTRSIVTSSFSAIPLPRIGLCSDVFAHRRVKGLEAAGNFGRGDHPAFVTQLQNVAW